MNNVNTEALNIGRKIHPGMGMFVRLLLIIVLPVFLQFGIFKLFYNDLSSLYVYVVRR